VGETKFLFAASVIFDVYGQREIRLGTDNTGTKLIEIKLQKNYIKIQNQEEYLVLDVLFIVSIFSSLHKKIYICFLFQRNLLSKESFFEFQTQDQPPNGQKHKKCFFSKIVF
jgi:hypothetical protein